MKPILGWSVPEKIVQFVNKGCIIDYCFLSYKV